MAKTQDNAPATQEASALESFSGRPDDEMLREIGTSIDDALETLRQAGFTTESASELIGTGFRVVDSNEAAKAALVGKPFLIVTWTFSLGDFGDFVTMWIQTQDGNKLIVSDGSTGIRDQLADLTKRRNKRHALWCPHGFRRSDYEMYTDENGAWKVAPRGYEGKTVPAATFYIDA